MCTECMYLHRAKWMWSGDGNIDLVTVQCRPRSCAPHHEVVVQLPLAVLHSRMARIRSLSLRKRACSQGTGAAGPCWEQRRVTTVSWHRRSSNKWGQKVS